MNIREVSLSNHEIVTLAVYALGGESKQVDTEDVAKEADRLVPGRFTWRKYRDQIDKELIRVFLSDAKKPKNGAYIAGVGNDGWTLTEAGLVFARTNLGRLGGQATNPPRLTSKEKNWRRSEKVRMLATPAFEKISSGQADKVTEQEAHAFFRLDSYITGHARDQKLLRARNVFGDDPDLGEAIRTLETKIRRD